MHNPYFNSFTCPTRARRAVINVIGYNNNITGIRRRRRCLQYAHFYTPISVFFSFYLSSPRALYVMFELALSRRPYTRAVYTYTWQVLRLGVHNIVLYTVCLRHSFKSPRDIGLSYTIYVLFIRRNLLVMTPTMKPNTFEKYKNNYNNYHHSNTSRKLFIFYERPRT